MRHTLTAIAAAALIALTGCGNGETAPPSPNIEPVQNDNPGKLQPNSDGYNMRILYQWIPEEPSIKPVDTRVTIMVMDKDQQTVDSYVTPFRPRDEVPSMDSDQYFTKDFNVPFDGIFSSYASVSDPPNTGRLTCIIVELDQQVVLDYQETEVGADESLSCYGFTHDEHEYDPGIPPVDVEFN